MLRESVKFLRVEPNDAGIYGCKIVTEGVAEWTNFSVTVKNPAADLQRDESFRIRDIDWGDHRTKRESHETCPSLESRNCDDDDSNTSLPPLGKIESPEKDSVDEGAQLELKCIPSLSPLKQCWYRNESILSNEEKARIEINKVKPEDSGKYTCKLLYESGCIQHTFKIRVEPKGEFSISLPFLSSKNICYQYN